jgi:acyl-CoA synthetase (AMP-forming)/AMP-acid ligase II
VGLPDGEWVHAVVVLQSDAAITLDEVRDLSREHIVGYKLPRSLGVVKALPMSGAGNVLKRELRRAHRGEEAAA